MYTIDEIKKLTKQTDYDFLRNDPRLQNIILLTLGGSYAYGTNTKSSDIDIRGCATNTRNSILLGRDFGTVTDNKTDTTIYSFDKLISLLTNMNPNTIEILGCKPEHYLYKSQVGEQLIYNRHHFLSCKCITSFSGYAENLLWRLKVMSNMAIPQRETEEHLCRALNNMSKTFEDKYLTLPSDRISFYLDESDKSDFELEANVDIHLTNCPVRRLESMLKEIDNTIGNHMTLGKRNEKAVIKNKLAKHMMHLVRLYLMCCDILEKEIIITYRENEHNMLMAIRDGQFLKDDLTVIPEFFEYLNALKKQFDYAKDNTSLPAEPDYKWIDDFRCSVNENIIKDWREKRTVIR